jgi:hypothetical protein
MICTAEGTVETVETTQYSVPVPVSVVTPSVAVDELVADEVGRVSMAAEPPPAIGMKGTVLAIPLPLIFQAVTRQVID